MTLCDKARDQATETAAEPSATTATTTEATTTMTTAAATSTTATAAATSTLGAGTYDGDVSACTWCGALPEPATAAEIAATTTTSASTAAEIAAMTEIAEVGDLPCLELTSHSTHIRHPDHGKWHLSAVGRLKMGRTADTKLIKRCGNGKGSASAFLHYLCVDDFSKLDWGCVFGEVYESVTRFEKDEMIINRIWTEFGPQLFVTDVAVRYDPSWALYSAKQEEVCAIGCANDMPYDRGYMDLSDGTHIHHSLIKTDEVFPGLSELSDGVRRTFRNLALVTSGEDVSWTHNLWFVDYDIRRVAGEARSEERQECRTATGTFVEVQRGDAGWDFGASTSHRLAESLMQVEEVITFMLVLGMKMTDAYTCSWVHDTPDDFQSAQFEWRRYVGPRLGVLAWEPGTCDTSGG
ncbi:hypothetical protein CONLIGDRAFT_644276 [Coniochaeta ligniaria NRRL 30616]|uniref:Uncharacterized protein n=1 Tax=Coniochaeta ligniaria NRRL 30616 TaxID=1408157 RepID=A0A1J7ISW8_9PEZI|nr:hypothetical protein CONLIGDRAFT_644276 [Coniochaeta ligniaria NRRL 30616]